MFEIEASILMTKSREYKLLYKRVWILEKGSMREGGTIHVHNSTHPTGEY